MELVFQNKHMPVTKAKAMSLGVKEKLDLIHSLWNSLSEEDVQQTISKELQMQLQQRAQLLQSQKTKSFTLEESRKKVKAKLANQRKNRRTRAI